jgi:hypothetical protein
MASAIKDIRLTHERDAAWLIALYLAIHGGDPAPKEGVVAHELQQGAALSAIAALSEALDEKTRAAVLHTLAPIRKQFPLKSVDAKVAGERLEAMGINFTEYAGEQAHAASATAANVTVTAGVQPPRPRCIRLPGQITCVVIRPHPIA